MNHSVKEFSECYFLLMSINRECLCCRGIDDIVCKKLSDRILIYGLHSHVKPFEILSNFQGTS